MLNINEINTAKDIPLGTILVEHNLSFYYFYEVINTTTKKVTLKPIGFDTKGTDDPTWREVTPNKDRAWYGEPVTKIIKTLKTGGFYIPAVNGKYGSLSIYNPEATYSSYWG